MKSQMGDVIYNATEQCFEAVVTFHTREGRVRIASRLDAPLTTELEDAGQGLWRNALMALDTPGAMQARLVEMPRAVPPRKPRTLSTLQRLTQSISRLAA